MKQEISISTSRIEAFSDGVIAILITVMVFDLKISEEIPVGNFFGPLMVILPKFLSYILSFVLLLLVPGMYFLPEKLH